MIYEYKVAWCKACDQGWVEIVKETATSNLLLMCSECTAQWIDMMSYYEEAYLEEEKIVETPIMDEIKKWGWEDLITFG
ncbi:hypothetical protein ACFO9Q_05475 [Paenibacillus sp. GCM10023252]|uniref:hypothetical protein n=1 Tax=Paenibacillus sp. GCM10023252 TaxID=3252649 RepID=UPI00362416CC